MHRFGRANAAAFLVLLFTIVSKLSKHHNISEFKAKQKKTILKTRNTEVTGALHFGDTEKHRAKTQNKKEQLLDAEKHRNATQNDKRIAPLERTVRPSCTSPVPLLWSRR